MMPVYVAGLERLRHAHRRLVDHDRIGMLRQENIVDQRTLAGPATPVTTVSTPVGMSTLTFCKLLTFAFLIGSLPVGVRKLL